jgi:hypothetical protein
MPPVCRGSSRSPSYLDRAAPLTGEPAARTLQLRPGAAAMQHNGHNGNGHSSSSAPRPEPSAQDLAIFEKRLAGHSINAIARELNLPAQEVDAAIDRALRPIDEPFRLQTIGLELERFDRLCYVFYAKALNGDAASAAIVLKCSERRSAILGLDVPAGSRRDPVVMQIDQTPQPTSTERIMAALNRIAAERDDKEPDEQN